MAGCCSGGTCSAAKPFPVPEKEPEIASKDGDSCSQSSCCDENPSTGLKESCGGADEKAAVHEPGGYNKDPRNSTVEDIPNPPILKEFNSSTSAALNLALPIPASNFGGCSQSSCCDGKLAPSQKGSGGSCGEPEQHGPCDDEVPNPPISSDGLDSPAPAAFDISFSPRIGGCSDGSGTCCVRKLSGRSESDPSQSQDLKTDVTSYTVVEVDGIERIIMDVQGMTCVGCEKNLIKALNSIRAISNIETSLLLCRAEFDFQRTEKLHSVEMVAKEIKKMTGFECKRVVDLGDELELILQPQNPGSSMPLPHGVSLEYRGRDRVMVTFNPSSIGARDLLSHPFFNHAKLAPPRPSASVDSGRAHLHKAIYMTLLSAILTIPVLVLAYGQFPKREVLYGAISLALATVIQVLVAGPFYVRAVRTLVFSKMIEMDMLVVLSTTTAYVYSVIAYAFMVYGQPLSTNSFFETSTLLVTIIMVGQTLGKLARQQAVESVSIESLQTQTAVIVDLKSQIEQKIDARLLQYGDTFKVLPDETVVTDGTVIEGETEVDESMITGEANLIKRVLGSSVIAGSINHSGTILVQLTRLPSENTIKAISALVDEAQSSKPKVQEIADVFAGYFTPAIVIMTVIVFAIWAAVGTAARHEKTSTACINAMTFAISTLIVSCPCAIGLAVPIVVVIACGVGARHGLILKRSETIEIGRNISHVVLDKTGTLTQEHPSVTGERYFNTSESTPSVVLGLTANSKHPVSIAIAKHLEENGVKAAHLEHVTSVPGCGMEGTWNGAQVRAGNQYWLGLEDSPEIQAVVYKGSTILCVAINNTLVAIFGLQDRLRPEAHDVINKLKERGIAVSLVSGDHAAAVSSIADRLSIAPEYVRSRCSPASKASYIKTLLSSPKSTVLFVGDGTNDAVALAQASIGMHMNSGTDVAQSAADTISMHSSLRGVITLIDLSNAFHRRVVFNFAWSLVYNVFAILLAAGAFEGTRGRVRIEPRYAGLGELVSVLPVIGVAVSLRWAKF